MCLHRPLFKDNNSDQHLNPGVMIFNRRALVLVIMPEEVIAHSAGESVNNILNSYIAGTAVIVFETAMLVVLVVLLPASSVAVTVMI